jgi:transcriptional regulator GlxA family with amidase domain
MRKTRLIAILVVPGVQLLDVSGPLDVFAEANVQAGRAIYRLQILAASAEPVRSSSGVRLLPDALIAEAGPPADTLLVAGAPHMPQDRPDPNLVDWLQRTAPGTRRYGSVCSGAFLLAAAGLLDGRRVATHWAVAEHLARRFPNVTVDADAIYLRHGKLRTAAGVTAGLDLALALVEEDAGRELAMRVASQLVMFFKRPGGQSQFSRHGQAGPAGRSVLQEVQRWAAANPSADLTVSALAARTALSERHFARLFRHEVGTTPGAWVDATRVRTARDLLERGAVPPKQVASLCGFADPDTLRRAFVRLVGVTPAEYRKRHASLDGAAE